MKKRTIAFRIILIVCGALAILAFFLAPVMHREKTEVEKAAEEVEATIEDLFPNALSSSGDKKELYEYENITAFKLVETAISDDYIYEPADDQPGLTEMEYFLGEDDHYFDPDENEKSSYSSVWQIIKYGIPLIFAIVLIVFGAIGGMVGGIGAIVSAVLMLAFYLIQIINWPKWKDDMLHMWKYNVSFWQFLILVIPVAAIVMGILEIVSAKKAAAQAAEYGDPYTGGQDMYGAAGQYDAFGGGYGQDGFGQGGYGGAGGCLIGVKGEYAGATIPIPDGARITIGRSSNDCNLVLQNQAVSRIHCYINYDAGRSVYTVMDVSKFGVFDINGSPIDRNTQVYMAPGDEIHIGKSHNVFRFG